MHPGRSSVDLLGIDAVATERVLPDWPGPNSAIQGPRLVPESETGTQKSFVAAARWGQTAGYWIVLVGPCLVLPGDAIYSWTWHQNGLTTPTPGTNPLETLGVRKRKGVRVISLDWFEE